MRPTRILLLLPTGSTYLSWNSLKLQRDKVKQYQKKVCWNNGLLIQLFVFDCICLFFSVCADPGSSWPRTSSCETISRSWTERSGTVCSTKTQISRKSISKDGWPTGEPGEIGTSQETEPKLFLLLIIILMFHLRFQPSNSLWSKYLFSMVYNRVTKLSKKSIKS